MKNIQKQYQDLLEGKMSKANFMRNVRMEFPQYVASGNSYEDAISILKSKRILSEAAKPEGVYGHNPNAEAPKNPGIDQLNYYQVYNGIQYELAKMPEISDETYIKARKKVVDTILKDPDAYKELQLANFRAVKAMDQDLKMKEVKPNNLVDKPNEMKVVKKDVKGNTQDTLEKKEKKKSKDAGIKQMTQTPKKAKGIAKVMEVPGKETAKTLKEHILDEMTRINPEHEHFNVGARVKKKDNSLVGEITEWDGDTATVKTDEGQVHHVQGNVLTKKDVPAPKTETAQTGTTDEWAKPKQSLNKESHEGNEQWLDRFRDALGFDETTPRNLITSLYTDSHYIIDKYGDMSPEEAAQKWLKDNEGTVNESRDGKMKSLKEKLMKTVKEMLYKKNNQSATASSTQGQSALKQAGYTEVPNTQDVKAI